MISYDIVFQSFARSKSKERYGTDTYCISIDGRQSSNIKFILYFVPIT
jgi:hypothetical protein